MIAAGGTDDRGERESTKDSRWMKPRTSCIMPDRSPSSQRCSTVSNTGNVRLREQCPHGYSCECIGSREHTQRGSWWLRAHNCCDPLRRSSGANPLTTALRVVGAHSGVEENKRTETAATRAAAQGAVPHFERPLENVASMWSAVLHTMGNEYADEAMRRQAMAGQSPGGLPLTGRQGCWSVSPAACHTSTSGCGRYAPVTAAVLLAEVERQVQPAHSVSVQHDARPAISSKARAQRGTAAMLKGN